MRKRIISILSAACCAGLWASGDNLLPDGSFEHGGRGAWNRMIDQSYLPDNGSWRQDDSTSFHGRYSLRGTEGDPLLLQAEGNFRGGVFSIYLKSAPPHPVVQVEVFSYSAFTPVKLASATFKTTGDWQRHHVKLADKWLRFERSATPVFIRLSPLGKGEIWADAAQLERGELTAYSEYRVLLPPAGEAEKILKSRFAVPAFSGETAKKGGPLPKQYKFTVFHPVAARAVPVSAALPFGEGEWFGSGGISVRSESGKSHPVQLAVTARWPKDGSVRSALLTFEGDLKAGSNTFLAEPGESRLRENVPSQELEPEIQLFAEDSLGRGYHASEVLRETESAGSVFRTILRRGLLCDTEGKSLAEYTLRTRVHHSDGTAVIDLTLTNPNEAQPLVLKSAGLRIASGKPGKESGYFQFYCPEKRKFSLEPRDTCGFVAGEGGTLLVREASLRHPVRLDLDSRGVFTGWLWPDSGKALILSRKMSLRREFVYSPSGKQEVLARFGSRATALASSEDFVRTGFFLIPIGRIEEKFPFMNKSLARYRNSSYCDPGLALTHPKKVLHGVFNYGDVYGDCGWGNLESYLDFSEILYAVCTDDPAVLRVALDRAEHYRDVDIVDGLACYHSSNHSGGFTHEFSHFWPQGVISHYLLTGDPRDADVIRQMVHRFLEVPVEYEYIQDSRSLGRYLLGLADLYALTGDGALRNRFLNQLGHAEKIQLGKVKKDRTIFPWHGRLDPFHVWYGCCALMEMYKLTGESRLLTSFRREMEASLNPDFYDLDLRECWPGLPPERALPIQLGYHSRHRGALFYPLMRFYSEITGTPEYSTLARRSAYTEFLRGAPKVWPMDILRLAVLNGPGGPADEKKLFTDAVALRRQAASPVLLNGDFSRSPDWFVHWHLPAGRQMGYDNAVSAWPLPDKKDFRVLQAESKRFEQEVSPWRGYSRFLGYLDRKEYFSAPPSLRVTLSGQWLLGRSTSLESVQLRISPGAWKITGAFRLDPGVDGNSFCRWNFTPEGMKTMMHDFPLGAPEGEVRWKSGSVKSSLKNVAAGLHSTSKPGWRKFEFRFDTPVSGIASLQFHLRLSDPSGNGNAFFDDINVEPVNLEKGKIHE